MGTKLQKIESIAKKYEVFFCFAEIQVTSAKPKSQKIESIAKKYEVFFRKKFD